jgi:hypothetical protein
MTDAVQLTYRRPGFREYLALSGIVAAGVAIILVATSQSPAPADARQLVGPMLAMFALTAVVWVLMVFFRFGAVLYGAASIKYFRDYKTEPPAEWIERAARTFNNQMQVPMLFYTIALLMMIIPWADRVQVSLAWMFVVMRVIHTAIYIGFNYVPFRFATYAVSCITLGVMWIRFALSV